MGRGGPPYFNVDGQDCQALSKFTGKINKTTLTTGWSKLSPADVKKLEAMQHQKKTDE